MLYQNYPYTDLQTFNLDGLLNRTKTNEEEIESNADAIVAETAARESAIAEEATARTTADANLLALIQAIDPAATKNYYTPQMYGAVADGITDDTQAIQDAIDAAHSDGISVFFPGGTYAINSVLHDVGTGRDVALKVYDGDTIFSDGTATLMRTNASVVRMLHTYADDDMGAYNAISKLNIFGINFDMNGDLSASQSSLIMMTCHAENVNIRYCTFKRCNGWHCIELNSTRNSRVENCHFSECGAGANAGQVEHIQIDAALSGTGAWGLLDGTVCYNLIMENNIHDCGAAVAVGNHTGAAHHDIIIDSCIFNDYTGTRGAVSFVAEQYNTIINNCTFNGCTYVQGGGGQQTYYINCHFNSMNTTGPLYSAGAGHLLNCWLDDMDYCGRFGEIGGVNYDDKLTELPPRSYSRYINNSGESTNAPVADAGVLDSYRIAGSNRYGAQSFISNSGLFLRFFNNSTFGLWGKVLTTYPDYTTNINNITDMAIGTIAINAIDTGTTGNPTADAGFCITMRNRGSGNFGVQIVLTNSVIRARRYQTANWESWNTIVTF